MTAKKPACAKWGGSLLVAGLLLLLACRCFAAPGETGEPSPLLERFESAYREVLRAAGSGALPISAGAEATDLWRELQRELAELEAHLQQLTARLSQAPPAERETLARQLIAGGAARQRLLTTYLERLDQLAGDKAETHAVTTSREPSRQRPPSTGDAQEESPPVLRLDFAPENLSRGRYE